MLLKKVGGRNGGCDKTAEGGGKVVLFDEFNVPAGAAYAKELLLLLILLISILRVTK